MQFVKSLIVIAVLVGIGYFVYMKFVKGEEPALPNIDLPTVDIETPYGKAVIALRDTRYKDAISGFKQVIAENKNPKEVQHSHFRLAQSCEAAKQYPEAIQAYEEAIKKYPNDENIVKYQKALDKLKLEHQ